MVKSILTALGIIVIIIIIFIAGFKVPDLLRNEQLSKNMPPNGKTPNASNENVDEKKWHDIWLRAIPGTDLDKLATKKLTDQGYFARKEMEKKAAHDQAFELSKTAKTMAQWQDIWFKSIIGTNLDKLAKEKLTKMGYFKQRDIAKIIAHQEAQQAVMSAKVERDWEKIWLKSIIGTDLDKLAKEKLDQFAHFKKSQLQKEIEHKNAEILALTITSS